MCNNRGVHLDRSTTLDSPSYRALVREAQGLRIQWANAMKQRHHADPLQVYLQTEQVCDQGPLSALVLAFFFLSFSFAPPILFALTSFA